MEVNYFLLLSCSLEKQLLVEWFFNYSTRRQCIVFLSSLVVLFERNLLEWGQLFSGEILWSGAIYLGAIFLRGDCPGGEGQFSLGDNCPRIKNLTNFKELKIWISCKSLQLIN